MFRIMKNLFAAIIVILFPVLQGAAQERAIVSLSAIFMRERPAYEAELGTQALMGTVVEVLDSTSYWRLVRTPDGYEAWTTEKGLAPYFDGYDAARKFIVTANASSVSSLPSASSRQVSDLVRGDVLLAGDGATSLGSTGQVAGRGRRKAPCSEEYVAVTLPDGRSGWVQASAVEDYNEWLSGRTSTGEAVVDEALRYVGVPYLWGGSSPKGFDCSGLTQMAYAMCGVKLPRNASMQAKLGEEVLGSAPIDTSALRKGDLLFFGRVDAETDAVRVTHVGMYIGDGRMVHSSQLVRVNSVVPGRPDTYENLSRFLFARRLL